MFIKFLNNMCFPFPMQVATLAVFTYFTSALLGRQFLIPQSHNNDDNFINSTISYSSKAPFNTHTPDFKLPIHTLVELLCYMGWIKVAETLLNPFGDDDEDFNVNYLIDRNLQVFFDCSIQEIYNNFIHF